MIFNASFWAVSRSSFTTTLSNCPVNPNSYSALGISEEWVPALQKAGYLTVDTLKEANANKLRQELCELNKKYKLELQNPTIQEIEAWIANVGE